MVQGFDLQQPPSHEELQAALFGVTPKEQPTILIDETTRSKETAAQPLSKVLMDRYHVTPGRSGHYARTEIVTPEFYPMLGHVTHKAEPHVSSYGSFKPKTKNKSSPFGRHKFTVLSSKSSRIAVEAPSGATSKVGILTD